MIANIPGSVPTGVDAVHNERPLGFGANINQGAAPDDGGARALGEPGRGARPGRGRRAAQLHGGASALRRRRPAHGLSRTARWQPSRRRFPTVAGTIVRRTPLRLVVPQRRHFHLDEAPPDRAGRGRLDARRLPAAAPRRCSTSSAASTRASASTARTSTCSTARCARAGSGGTSRGRRPPRAQGGDRQALADAPHALALGGGRALRAQAPRAAEGADEGRRLPKYDAVAERYSAHDYADAAAYYARRAQRRRRARLALAAGRDACSTSPAATAVSARHLLDARRRLPAASTRATRMVEVARRTLGDRRVRSATFEYVPPEPVDATTIFRSLYLVPDRRAFLEHVLGFTRVEARLRLRPARARGRRRSSPTCARPAGETVDAAPVPDAAARIAAGARAGATLSALEPLPGARALTRCASRCSSARRRERVAELHPSSRASHAP